MSEVRRAQHFLSSTIGIVHLCVRDQVTVTSRGRWCCSQHPFVKTMTWLSKLEVRLCCYRLGPQAVVKTYKGAEHTEILSNDDAVADLLDILTEDFRESRVPGLLNKFWRSIPRLQDFLKTV